jgi:hypothetical protein
MIWLVCAMTLAVISMLIAAAVLARKSRAAAERYLRASPEERALLETRMAQNPLLSAHMRPMSIIQVVLAIVGAILLNQLLHWWRS